MLPSPQPKFVCADCGRRYKAMETLNRHRKNHITGVQYTCSECGTCFKRKDLLDRHVLIHDNERPISNTSRSGKACDRCSRLKTKCDGLSTCARCNRGGHFCTYKTTRTRAGRSSTGTLSPGQSPHPSISEAGSPTTHGYSPSEPGDSVSYNRSWRNTSDFCAPGSQDLNWNWPASLDSNLEDVSSLASRYLPPLQPPQLSSPSMWTDTMPGDILDCFQIAPGSLNGFGRSHVTNETAVWPQYTNAVPQIDPALVVGEVSYSLDDFSAAAAQCLYNS